MLHCFKSGNELGRRDPGNFALKLKYRYVVRDSQRRGDSLKSQKKSQLAGSLIAQWQLLRLSDVRLLVKPWRSAIFRWPKFCLQPSTTEVITLPPQAFVAWCAMAHRSFISVKSLAFTNNLSYIVLYAKFIFVCRWAPHWSSLEKSFPTVCNSPNNSHYSPQTIDSNLMRHR